jgi:SAM-dependent methyltransferase
MITVKNSEYVLGHSDFELKRLARQARLLEPATRECFQAAGLAPGMRVLDVGSGTGEVAFLAADFVGPSGEVLGTDIASTAVAAARDAARARGQAHVSFREGDPGDMLFEHSFDFIVGRCVLHHQADPTSMLCQLAKHLRPGGTILFLEPDWSFVRSEPPAPTYDRCCRWIIDIFDRVGAGITNTGVRMHRAFLAAGLPSPMMRMRVIIGDAVSAKDWLQAVADIAIVMLPTMEEYGIATTADIDCATIAERLVHEVMSNASIVIGRAEVGAWSQV